MDLKGQGLKISAVVVALLAVMFVITSTTAVKKSHTWDEPAHLLAGYAYLDEGMDWLSPLNHTVFGRSVTAFFPWLLLDMELDTSVKPEKAPGSDFFPYSLKFLFENRTPGMTVLFFARLGVMLTGLLLGAYVYLFSSSLWGRTGGLFSLFLYVLSPNMLAHAGLATTDMPVTAFFFISAFYLFNISTKGISPGRILGAAVFISLALTSKHTALLLAPLVLASFFVTARAEGLRKTVISYLFLVVVAYAAIWAVYGMRYGSASPLYVAPAWEALSGSAFAPLFDLLRTIRFLPESYLYSLAGTLTSAEAGKEAYLFGRFSASGWWYYFPIAFLVKTPMPTLLFLVAAVLYIFAGPVVVKRQRRWALALILPVAVVMGVAAAQKVNIGLRHVLIIYPFIFTLLGFVPGIRTGNMRAARGVFLTACAWYVIGAALIYPHQLAYFNELAGGPKNGPELLIDSNIDWGQDLVGLKDFMDDNSIEEIKLGYFGYADPAHYGIKHIYMPSLIIHNPRLPEDGVVNLEGWFAISATLLKGGYLPPDDKEFYRRFRAEEPVARIGYSIYVYRFEGGQ